MGPWHIRDIKAPFRPGCSFETMKELVKRGRITRETVVRGPTTRQFWNFAGRTPTIANLLGVCHNCGGDVLADAYSCAACGAVFTPETDRQHLGLAPVHLLPGHAAPEIIAASSGAPARAAAERRREAQVAVARAKDSREGPRSRWPLWTAAVLLALVIAGVVVVQVVGLDDLKLAWERLIGKESAPVAVVPAPTKGPAPAPVAEPPADPPVPAATGPTSPTGATGPSLAPTGAPAVPVPAPTGAPPDELSAIGDALAAGTEIDSLDLLSRLAQFKLRQPQRAAEADALAELVKKRAAQGRLKKLA
jgi:hypothetical protein